MSGYADFSCIAAACPDTCCVGWEVVVDDHSRHLYQSLPGVLGDRLRTVLTKDVDGDWIFQNLPNGHCPFWNAHHLCDLQCNGGEALLCQTCREFPRIAQDYTIFTEHLLSLACPEAARLLLTRSEPLHFSKTKEEPSESESLPYDWDTMVLLHQTRDVLLSLFAEDTPPLSQQLQRGFAYVHALQCWWNGSTEQFPEEIPAAIPSPWKPVPLAKVFPRMTWLTPVWKQWAEDWQFQPAMPEQLQAFSEKLQAYTPILRQFCRYHICLYWLQAIADDALLLRYEMLLTALECVAALGCWLWNAGIPLTEETLLQWLSLYNKEVMHNTENVELLEDFLLEQKFADEGESYHAEFI